MEKIKLSDILPYASHAGVELYLNEERIRDEEEFLKTIKDSFNYIVTSIRPFSDEEIAIYIKESEKQGIRNNK